MEFHPIAAIFPLLEGAELTALADDIRVNGLREAVWLYQGKILDGRNRAAACRQAGVTLKTKEFAGTEEQAIAFVWSENRRRRHLVSGQIAIATAKRDRMQDDARKRVEGLKEDAAKRQRAAGGDKKSEAAKAKAGSVVKQITQPIPTVEETKTRTIRAKAAGTNARYMEAADKLVERAETEPAIAAKVSAVEKGQKTLSQVIREVKHEECKANNAPLPNGKYRIFYADPPWNYGNSGSGLDQYGPAERHYPAMTIAELCAMDIKGIAGDDAVLFLWVTSPLLDECWPIIKAWGFNYKTSFVWDKVKHNFGHYNSVRHELLLVCTRGSCTPDAKELIDSVVEVERSKAHSGKPERFREIIDQLYPHGKRIELFARKNTKGWEAYGNEC